ncbi:EAL domain-containing protein [Janthinobacterium sp. 17J80-10]|uniref:EAL domain-containing protein n=1 Tax=Janthinobacterium sp. 17J80-10 TaxID=2497863 RepID=UPI0010054D9C|nr:EAL domain-containing protein [Janthinobacterium sp. 17J80-10]QAU32998.1 EAL domain-containing protein [Janthinobacterium sp. 17J80-10]
MKNKFFRLIRSLTVGRKLALIYFLDLTAVIFVSAILINEKFIAIDFARKEIVGNYYIAAIRDTLMTIVDPASSLADDTRPRRSYDRLADAITQAEKRHGAAMDSATLSVELADNLKRAAAAGLAGQAGISPQSAAAFATGRELLTRVGNQSNLILDPDLDSYYTMSLIVLRFPELLEVLHQTATLTSQMAGASTRDRQINQPRFLILAGRLDAIVRSIRSDYAEAFSASTPLLKANLTRSQDTLLAATREFRNASQELAGINAQPATVGNYPQIRHAALQALDAAWLDAAAEIERLLHARIDHAFSRMWTHLGVAGVLLLVILSIVFFVARQIALPIVRLERLTDRVRHSGDYSLRANWDSDDEIGRLVASFNNMLEQLDHHRVVQQELVAQTRAAQAQRELVEAIPIPLMVTAIPNHEVLHANDAARAWLSDQVENPWHAGMDQSSRARFFQGLSDLGSVSEFEVRWRGGDKPSWALVSARRLDYQGQDAVLTTFTPTNNMKQMEKRLELWAKVFEASSESIVIIDADSKIAIVNRAFCRNTGFSLEELIGTSPMPLLADRHGSEFVNTIHQTAAGKGFWQGEIWINRKEGTAYPAWLVLNAVRNNHGNITHFIAISFDITERKENEQRIHYLAHHDALTGLPNRILCAERLQLSIQQASRTDKMVAVLFIDLDRFKNINDSLGHHVGDRLLCSVAERLSQAVREGDTVSRLGGDEFVVILNGIASVDEIGTVVERRMLPLILRQHDIDGAELFISCSVGVAVFPDDGKDIGSLMRHSDAAMYQAKEQGRNNVQFFTPQLNERVVRRLRLENDLRHATERNELLLYYQPRVCARTGALAGVEALVRWQHPADGMVAPDSFISIAEESGLIIPIGDWIIREAFRQHLAWRENGLGNIPVSINLSGMQIKNGDLAGVLSNALAEFPVQARDFELELTESILMDDVTKTIAVLEKIKALGFTLSVDDFGTGYSSLNYLYRFPIDKLKVDRSFIQNIHVEPHHLAVTKAIIGLGHTLGLEVVAEGVEHEIDVTVLRAAGCDEFQGYYFARPMPVQAFALWLQQYRNVAAATPLAPEGMPV